MAHETQALHPTRLAGHWGSLRPLDPERDASSIYRLSHDNAKQATWLEMKIGPFPTKSAFVEHMVDCLADPKRAFFAVADGDDRALGWLCLMEASAAHGSIELGYVLFPPVMQRTTLATEAFLLIMSHVFDDLAYQRLEWTCTATNERSRRAADRLGFGFEGIMRRKFTIKGISKDIAMYSMLADEWPDRRKAMQAWLRPSNFENGQQRHRLAQSSN